MPIFNDEMDENCLALLISKSTVDLITELNDNEPIPQEFLENPSYYVMPFGEGMLDEVDHFTYADDFYKKWSSGDGTFPEQMKGRPILVIRSE